MSTQAAEQKFTGAQRLAGIANSFVASSAINAVIRLNIADLLGDGEMDMQSLAKKTETDESKDVPAFSHPFQNNRRN